jgi:hypothetical protein
MTANALSQAIAAAKGAAAALPAEVAGTVQQGRALAPVAGPGVPMSLSDLIAGDMQVDKWLKVNPYGLFIGQTNIAIVGDLVVSLDLSEVVGTMQIKAGNPVKYWKTLDHQTCLTGGSWMDAIAEAQAIDPKARPYRSADLPFVALSQIKDAQGNVVAEPGERIGHSLATTSWKSFSQFLHALQNQKLPVDSGKYKVTLGYQVHRRPPNTWATLEFKAYEPLTN